MVVKSMMAQQEGKRDGALRGKKRLNPKRICTAM